MGRPAPASAPPEQPCAGRKTFACACARGAGRRARFVAPTRARAKARRLTWFSGRKTHLWTPTRVLHATDNARHRRGSGGRRRQQGERTRVRSCGHGMKHSLGKRQKAKQTADRPRGSGQVLARRHASRLPRRRCVLGLLLPSHAAGKSHQPRGRPAKRTTSLFCRRAIFARRWCAQRHTPHRNCLVRIEGPGHAPPDPPTHPAPTPPPNTGTNLLLAGASMNS